MKSESDVAADTAATANPASGRKIEESAGSRRTEPLFGLGRDSPAASLLDRRQRRVVRLALPLGLLSAAFAVPVPGLLETVVLVAAAALFLAAHALRAYMIAVATARLGRSAPRHQNIHDELLPTYTILAPLYHEANVVAPLVRHLREMDYPTDRLDIYLLCEQDDSATIAAVRETIAGYRQFRLIVCPPGEPRTKPRACNIGLLESVGELCVIFDAEDRPDKNQLRRAAAAFAASPDEVICFQARLDYYNHDTNWLTRWFTIEYGSWFAFMLPGLAGGDLPLPLGGTSNHFRTDALCALGGWDPYNVTEDADLGLRLHAAGARTRMLASTTMEEACALPAPWIRQRTRWLKGYLQTWAVHSRASSRRGLTLPSRLSLHLLVGGTPLSALMFPALVVILPVLWLGWWRGGPEVARPLAVGISAVVAAALMLLLLSGLFFVCIERRWRLLPAALSYPLYYFLISLSSFRAAFQLIVKPHVWEKTPHGLTGHDTDPARTARPTSPSRTAAARRRR